MSTVIRGSTAGSRATVVARLDALLTRSAQGDEAAFASLYAETAPLAFGVALRLLRDRALAEDAVQEAYLTVWRTAARFDARKGTSRGWILMIVHRVAVDHVRSTDSRSARDNRDFQKDWALRRSDSDPTHDLAHASLEAHLARAALAGLSARQRQALELAYFEGHTSREVAQLLGIPIGTAKSRIRDGLISLRESMAIQEVWSARWGHCVRPSP